LLMEHQHSSTDPAPGAQAAMASAFRQLSQRQRQGLAVAAAAILVGLLWMARQGGTADLVPLRTSEPFTAASLRELKEGFREAGLTGFRLDDEQILVPREQLAQYQAHLAESADAAGNWAAEWQRQNERLTPFSSSRDREASREIARAKHIVEMLSQLPDVEHADVVWDEDERPGWRQAPRARATVYLKPRPGRTLTVDVIRSVRHAVAGSKKNLDPSDVVVMDLVRQVTYDGELPALPGRELLPALHSLAELYRRELQQQIPPLQYAQVAVTVELPAFFEFLGRHPADAAEHLAAQAPGLLRVAVEFPQRVAPEWPRTAGDLQNLRERIVRLTGIGSRTEDASHQILISLPEQPEPELAFPAALRERLAGASRRWIVLGGLPLMALVLLLARRLPKRPGRRKREPLPTLHDVGAASRSHAAQTPVWLSDFEDLRSLSLEELRALYSHATPRRWAIALRGSERRLAEHLAAALTPSHAAELQQECLVAAPVTLSEIESSRRRILESVQTWDVE
jgi:Secretory protein of YscJ/FliF family/FliG C-terminal domain